ncbi:MAG: YdiU family protein [Betaproteobacteria bacterium HGW-Betaproteobacteria-22]|nr:MAG: YdiU family protein [Betaproteobacteria bacterium HGW-Betaproteobacteria-22]
MSLEQALISESFGFNFDNSYLQLPPVFYRRQLPTAVKNPRIVIVNDVLATSLNLDAEALNRKGGWLLAGNTICPGSEPIAQAYAGHQFGGFNMLGDGRAILLGEHIAQHDQRYDIQLKGAGRTPYSRRGDGRAALGPMMREYLMSEAMHALGIPTTRSLAVIDTGEVVYREGIQPGAVLTRVASSHIRVGTFQFAAVTHNNQQLQALADYTILRHFPEIAEAEHRYLALLERVVDLQASLIAQWMNVGFMHGVMNTDNMSIAGETIDYGPCAFINIYHPETVFSSVDVNGRYAFGRQPKVAHWNLIRFAETLLPLIDVSEKKSITLAAECLDAFPAQFFAYWLAGMRKKLGLFNQEAEDQKLAEDLLMYMQKHQVDFTNGFRALGGDAEMHEAMYQDAGFQHWLRRWEARLARQKEHINQSKQLRRSANPSVIPRNHLVEEALAAAVDEADITQFHTLVAALADPYTDLDHPSRFMQPPGEVFDRQYKTYCGT